MSYVAGGDRYDQMRYNRCGRSGLALPAISLGLWQNFGGITPLETGRAIVRRAFDLGVTHFDLANNYGPPYGSAEENFGRIMRDDLRPYRDELVISTKAGYDMWPGPYGDGGSRKYLLASLDQSLAPARPRLRRHLLLASRRPVDAARGDDGRARQRRAAGQGALRRDLVLLRREDAGGARDPPRPRHAAPDPPALVLDPEPLDRAGPRRDARRARGGMHHVLAARPGRAHGPLPPRHPGGLPCEPQRVARARDAHRGGARQGPGAERDRRGARPVARPDGARLDAARPADHLDAPRRQQRRPARAESRCPRQPRVLRPRSSTRSTAIRPRAPSTSGRDRATARRSPS